MSLNPTRRRPLVALTLAVLTACSGTPAASPPAPASTTTSMTTAPATTTVPASTTVVPVPTTVASRLPLGDGKLSTAAQAGSLFSCQTTFGPAGGAFRDGPWIGTDGTWDPAAKLHVQGSVSWPEARYTLERQGPNRVITTNDVPGPTVTGVFPVAAGDPAYQYDRNPNTITPRTVTYLVPADPAPADAPRCVNMGAIGVLGDGVLLFNALDGQGRDAAAHEVLDGCDGHPERTGQYHHHTVASCVLAAAGDRPTLVGYALDGFGIYVERRGDGSMPTDADLDACHGRTGPVAWDGATVTMYHYVATAEYPYTVGCYRGIPVVPPR